MVPHRLVINNGGPTAVVFNPVIAGTALDFPLYFEDETALGSGVYGPMDFSGGTFVSQCRYSPTDVAPVWTLAITQPEPGWVNIFLSASQSLAMGNNDVYWSLKFIPASPNEEYARELAAGIIPIRYGATR